MSNHRASTSLACLAALALGAQAPYALAEVIYPDVPVAVQTEEQNEPELASDGTLLTAVWYRDGGSAFSRANVGTGFSLDGGTSWMLGDELPLRESDHVVEGRPSICALAGGRFFVAARYTGEGFLESAAVFRGQLTNGRLQWSMPIDLFPSSQEIRSPRTYDAIRITSDQNREILYLTATRYDDEPFPSYDFDSNVLFVRSTDAGVTWSEPLTLSGNAANGARPAVGPDGELYVFWHEYGTSRIVGRKSTDFGQTFGNEFVVGTVFDNPNTAPPGYRVSGRRINPFYSDHYRLIPNYPSVDVDRSTGPRRGHVYIAWSEAVSGDPAPVPQATTNSEPENNYFAGATPISIGDDVQGYLHSADQSYQGDVDTYAFQGEAGTTIWISAQIDAVYGDTEEPLENLFRIFCVRDTATITFLTETRFRESRFGPLPPVILTLPYTGTYYLQTGSTSRFGLLYSLRLRRWQSHADQVARDQRDIVLVTSSDGGATWSGKIRVNDDPALFDNCFPEVVVDGQGQVHAVWYDRRDDPECGKGANVYWSVSRNGGVGFEASRRVSTVSSDWNRFLARTNVGEHMDLIAVGDRVHATWTDFRGGDPDVYTAAIEPDATAVAIGWLRAEPGADGIRVSWYLAEPNGVTGFRLHRSESEDGEFEPVPGGPIPSSGEGEYAVVDNIAGQGIYRYQLEIIRASGVTQWVGPVEVSFDKYTAWQWTAQPNPFRENVSIALAVPRSTSAYVGAYDISGRLVRELYKGDLAQGTTTILWDGRDDRGQHARAGIYFVRWIKREEELTKTVIRVAP